MYFSGFSVTHSTQSPRKLPSSLTTYLSDFKKLCFEDQCFFLSQALYNKALQLNGDECVSRKITQMLADLNPLDFFEVLETMENDVVLKKWVNSAAMAIDLFN